MIKKLVFKRHIESYFSGPCKKTTASERQSERQSLQKMPLFTMHRMF